MQKSAEELLRISKEAQFRKALSTAKYEYHANSFQRAAETAIEKAKAKNIDGVTLAYMEMTQTCVRCHQHTREERIGRLTPPAGRGDAIGN
jgi:cytochrome c556